MVVNSVESVKDVCGQWFFLLSNSARFWCAIISVFAVSLIQTKEVTEFGCFGWCRQQLKCEVNGHCWKVAAKLLIHLKLVETDNYSWTVSMALARPKATTMILYAFVMKCMDQAWNHCISLIIPESPMCDYLWCILRAKYFSPHIYGKVIWGHVIHLP